jgi:hypothetical protein
VFVFYNMKHVESDSDLYVLPFRIGVRSIDYREHSHTNLVIGDYIYPSLTTFHVTRMNSAVFFIIVKEFTLPSLLGTNLDGFWRRVDSSESTFKSTRRLNPEDHHHHHHHHQDRRNLISKIVVYFDKKWDVSNRVLSRFFCLLRQKLWTPMWQFCFRW